MRTYYQSKNEFDELGPGDYDQIELVAAAAKKGAKKNDNKPKGK